MNTLQAAILGAVQGLAEFLPVSSSGHLIVFRSLLGLGDVPVLFDVLLHVSTLLAVCIVYRKRLASLIMSLCRWIARGKKPGDDAAMRTMAAILVATIATAAIGYFVNKIDLEGSPRVVALLLVVTAAILVSGSLAKGSKREGEFGWVEGLFVGVAQGIGVFPGISRSGITITASRFAGLERSEAGDFSFLISIPAILGALALKLKDMPSGGLHVDALPLAVAIAVSFVVGLASLLLLRAIIRKASLAWFAIYLVPAGLLGYFLLNK